MKKFAKMFTLAVLMIIGGQAMAQTRGAMFLSAAFPMNDYAKFDGFDDFALTSTSLDDNNVGAGIGFDFGLKWYFNVGVKGLGVMLSLDGIYNAPNADLKSAYRDGEGCFGNDFLGASFTYNSTPKYFNVPAMLGLNYIFHLNPNFGVYIEGGAGGNLRFITEMEGVTKANIGPFEAQTKVTNSYDNAFTFAYQFGAGIEVAKNLVIGCSFYDLGKADVKGQMNVKNNPDFPREKTWGSVHPIMVLGRIGFSF
mgnify:FL=1